MPFLFGGEGGIRTHVPFPANAFRVRPVMTTSIPLHMLLLRTGDTAFKRKLPVRRDLFYQKAHLIAI